MDNQERDIIVFVDEDDNEIEMEVLDYFYYNGEEFAVLTELTDEVCECPEGEECTCEPAEIMFAKVVPLEDDEDNVSFEPVEDEELADKLFEIINSDLDVEGNEE